MSFKDELNASTRNPSEVREEKMNEEFKKGYRDAQGLRYHIKQALLKNVNNGNYRQAGSNKYVECYIGKSSGHSLDLHLIEDFGGFHLEYSQNRTPGGWFRNPTYSVSARYTCSNKKYYEGFLYGMKELENEDGIHAKLIAIYESMDRHRYEFDPFTGATIDQMFFYPQKCELYVKASVTY